MDNFRTTYLVGIVSGGVQGAPLLSRASSLSAVNDKKPLLNTVGF